MRTVPLLLALTCLAFGHPVTRDDLKTNLGAVQRALGGADKLATVTRIKLSGTMRYKNQAFGNHNAPKEQFVDVPFVTLAMLPDYFLERQDRGTNISYAGFAKDALLNHLTAVSGTASAHYPADMIEREREKCGYLMLPLLLRTDTAFHFAFLEARENQLLFRSQSNIRVNLEFDPSTMLPKRLSWEAREMTMEGKTTGTGLTVIEIGDYRKVDDLMLPHRLIWSHRDELVVDRTITEIVLNPDISEADFQK